MIEGSEELEQQRRKLMNQLMERPKTTVVVTKDDFELDIRVISDEEDPDRGPVFETTICDPTYSCTCYTDICSRATHDCTCVACYEN